MEQDTNPPFPAPGPPVPPGREGVLPQGGRPCRVPVLQREMEPLIVSRSGN